MLKLVDPVFETGFYIEPAELLNLHSHKIRSVNFCANSMHAKNVDRDVKKTMRYQTMDKIYTNSLKQHAS